MATINTTLNVDVAIIGTGTAGMGAYREAVKHTQKVALIEASHYGTTCARVGCMPSKLLIAAAEAAHHARHTEAFGVNVGSVEINGKAVLNRVKSERDRFVGFVNEAVEGFNPEHKVTGFARFIDNHRLSITNHDGEEREIVAQRIIIATGSRPSYPDFFKRAGDRLLVNDDIFELDTLPSSVAVFGPGVIGLELGQALSRLGVEVKVFGRGGGIGGLQSSEVRDYALATFNEEFYLDPDAEVVGIDPLTDSNSGESKGVQITYHDKNGQRVEEQFDYLLAATGRVPNVDRLDLENTHLETDDRGVPVFNRFTMQTNVEHIFIAGDANNDIPLLHEAADEGRIAGSNAGKFPDIQVGKRRTHIGIVFTEPQISSVGLGLHEIEAKYPNCYASGSVNFEGQGRSRVMLKNKGILKVYAQHGTGLFLGAEMFGPAAEHIAHLLSWAVQQQLTVSEILDMPFYHPVIEEGVRTALRELNADLHIGPKIEVGCLDCGVGA